MASLMKKLCDTMPLAGVVGALAGSTAGGFKASTVGQLSRHLRFHATLSPIRVSCSRASRVDEDATPIWGYDVPADPTRIKRVTCRVSDDNYNEYLVLEELEWGHAPQDDPAAFRPSVCVALDAQTVIDLPFIEAARLMTFTTKDGQNPEDSHPLWPLEARHDPSILHVFAYDITLGAGKVVPLKDPDHPDAPKIRKLVQRLEEINKADPADDRKAEDFLFEDDLWSDDHAAGTPSGAVPENVELTFRPIRVLVATSLTVCRERDDYQPGRPAGVGRIYPHVMVVASADLPRIDAGVRLKRPSRTTLLDAEKCGCGEMLPEIGSLLVTDANSSAMMLQDAHVAPPPIWANLFNYYVADAFQDPTLNGKLIPVVSPLKTGVRDTVGLVERSCRDFPVSEDNEARLKKLPRQGYFDNIHLAPRMRVNDHIDWAKVGTVTVPFNAVADWKMDSIVMAPFCAHDCFHVHWRWTDHANTDRSTHGWGSKSPYKIAGATMVPANQRVGLHLLSEHAFSYLAQAREAHHDEWQPFFHHGAGYALSVGTLIKLAKKMVLHAIPGSVTFFANQPPLDVGVGKIERDPAIVAGDWALFYWRCRYAVRVVDTAADKTLTVVERFQFKDKQAALKL